MTEGNYMFEISPLFVANKEAKERTIVNQGGTSSGKTYSLMQVLFLIGIEEPRSVITVVGQDVPNLKKGAYRDAKTILAGSELLSAWWPDINEGERLIKCQNGSLIEFTSYKDAQDAKSGKRDYLFVNEANGISYEVYWQLAIRTRKRIFIDYNPTARFWVHDNILGRDGVKLIISDHRKNHFLTAEEHDRIEHIEDDELWKVYARGLTGMIQGLVLTNWDIVDMLPPREEWKMSCYGLDFGFTNDPSALEHVIMAHGELWIDERIYSTGLTNPDIANRAKDGGIGSEDQIVADCAEPKSIRELQAHGLWVTASPKGQDSIVSGLDILKRYRIHVTRRSTGIISNMRAYKWANDRDGNMTNKPEDRNNHGIDAIRYVALLKLAQHREVRGVRRRN
jgi:phage terminase large subunit